MKNSLKFSITGFVLSIVIISLFAAGFGVFISEMQDEYGITGDTAIGNYNITQSINSRTQEIRNATDIEQDEGLLDIIGGFFSSGYSALKITIGSFGLFEGMMNDASTDVPYLGIISDYIIYLLIIILFVGVLIAALLKWAV